MLVPVMDLFAEGSKDLYPDGTPGNRAFLISMTGDGYTFNPFNTMGRMMVYVKAGETIYVGSSSQGLGTGTVEGINKGTIKLYAPNGAYYCSGTGTTQGVIQNREQERNGPRTSSNQSGYVPYTRVVKPEEEGIWVVEFYARGTDMSGEQSGSGATQSQNTTVIYLPTTTEWNTGTTDNNTHENSAFITAWDVTVGSAANANEFISGRLYTTVFNLGMDSQGNPDGFYGKFYALTRDGFSYLVDNRGHNGLSFNTFVNNKGTLKGGSGDDREDPDYKTFTFTNNPEGRTLIRDKFHDPRTEDNQLHVTHKMFYNKPAADMPETAAIWQPESGTFWPEVWNNTTGAKKEVWLYPTRGSIIPKDLRLIGVEGIEGYYTTKGANFVFESEVEGRYNITIPAENPANNRVLEGSLFIGENKVYWDGLDAAGSFMLGENLSDVTIKVLAAEVHFPFIDVENNVNGISIQALDMFHNMITNDPDHDKVWWNLDGFSDGMLGSNILNDNSIEGYNSLQESITVGGNIRKNLRWGENGGGNNFGDNKAVVEWINQTELSGGDNYTVTNLMTDLEVVSVTRESNSFEVKVKNNGPHDAFNETSADHSAIFMFFIPIGLTIDPSQVEFSYEGRIITYNGEMTFSDVEDVTDPLKKVSRLEVKLNMPAGAVGTFDIPFSFDGNLQVETINAWGTIMRAHDVNDPNALNTDINIMPTCPFEQANGVWMSILDMTEGLNVPVETNHEFDNLRGSINGSIPVGHVNYTNNIKYTSFSIKNYWYGTYSGNWGDERNWTANYVPIPGQDIEFATADNNSENVEYPGAAIRDLLLDSEDHNDTGGRIIGNLVNNSEVDLVITAGNQLTINGTVIDNNPDGGTILVKSTNIITNENEPTGTLLINSENNPDGVKATVEFYNKAYDCADCGYYTRSWQYFGVPVVESGIIPPFTSDNEVNQWYEPTNGVKWITPNMPLTAFTGYQVTRNTTAEPDFNNGVHIFDGLLNINNASVGLTRTVNVNYSGANLIANSYTAAIPIADDALSLPSEVEKTVYLFNTGTRDQWRKLNGNLIVGGVAGGQYLAVPINLAGQPGTNLPDRIPSMHTFMVLLPEGSSGSNLGINYDKLMKNTTVDRGDGTQIVTRSANSDTQTTATASLPYMMVDVIGEKSADRLWIFVEESTSHGFDNGWDGRKMTESGIAQLYVEGSDESLLQVATVPTMDNVTLGFTADADGKYTLEFLLSEQMNSADIFLHDLVTGTRLQISNGTSYSFEAEKGEIVSRFSLSQKGDFVTISDETIIIVDQTEDGKVVIRNGSGNTFTAFISNANGAILNSIEVVSGSEEVVEDIDAGIYVIRLQNAVINDVRRLIVK